MMIVARKVDNQRFVELGLVPFLLFVYQFATHLDYVGQASFPEPVNSLNKSQKSFFLLF